MSSKSTVSVRPESWLWVVICPCAMVLASAPAVAQLAPERSWEPIELAGEVLPRLLRCPVERVEALACRGAKCTPIPIQVDEQDPGGRWVLDVGSEGAQDEEPGLLDRTDRIVLLAGSLGAPPSTPASPREGIRVVALDPVDGQRGEAVVRCGGAAEPAPRIAPPYDPVSGRVWLRRAQVRFAQGLPRALALNEPENVLDRLKVRAQATWLWGLLRLTRDEEDLESSLLGWRAGPLRVLRVQAQWVRLGYGLRTPILRSYAAFYPDAVVLPLAFRLRFPAAFFFSSVRVEVYADFRDLRGWQVMLPNGRSAVVDGRMDGLDLALNGQEVREFALVGPAAALLASVGLSPSLASLRQTLLYRDGFGFRHPPEEVPGELPGIGFEFTNWQSVGSGTHGARAVLVVFPNDASVGRALQTLRVPLEVQVQPIPSPSP